MTEKVTYVPTVIQWKDKSGTVQQRTINIEEGLSLAINGKKNYTAQAYEYNGKKPLLNVDEDVAYSILGFSRVNDDKDEKNNIYTLDRRDFSRAQEADGSNIANYQYGYLDALVKGYANSQTQKNLLFARFAIDGENDNKPKYNEFQMTTKGGNAISIFNNKK